MFETHELEALVVTIKNQSNRISTRVMGEYFAEAIEKKLELIPVKCRDEFMQIAQSYGYKSASERMVNFLPNMEPFDDGFYDDLFPLSDDDWH